MKKGSGFSLVELMVGLVIFTIVTMAAIRGGINLRMLHQKDADTSFATQKCTQMMDELRSEAAREGGNGRGGGGQNFSANSQTSSLETFDDGNSRVQWLSALARRDAANGRIVDLGSAVEYPPSGNRGRRFESQIKVQPLSDNDQAKFVSVKVWRRSDGALLAESAGIVGTVSPKEMPRQWYAPIIIQPKGVPFAENSVSGGSYYILPWNPSAGALSRIPYVQPGGTPLVNRMGYGRDRYYLPNGNSNLDGTVYRDGSNHTELGQFTHNSLPYAHYLANWAGADQNNHSLRYPRELAVFKAQLNTVAGKQWEVVRNGNSSAFAPPLDVLLQSMLDRDPEYTKPLLVIGTPEVLPIPPLRNYSDAAKDTTTYPDMRAVVHPQNLEYASGAPVSLRVYTYAMNPDTHTEAETIANVTVLIKANILPSDLAVRRLVGNGTTGYVWANASMGTDFVAVSTTVGGNPSLKIVLKNSPVRMPYHIGTGSGLPANRRLFGLEYIPCPVGTAGTPYVFGEGVKDLTSAGNLSKNTARWVLNIAGGAMPNGEYTVETRLGDQVATGSYDVTATGSSKIDTLAVENYSDTYFWMGQQAPFVERYQFLGDPRHMPYADVKARQGYNRYFSSIPAGDYEGYIDTTQGWSWSANSPNPGWTNSGRLNSDVPRYMQLWREALLNSNGILVTGSSWKTGRFANYLSLGGEVYTSDYLSGNKVKGLPWDPTSSALIMVSEFTDPRRRDGSLPNFDQAYQRVVAKSDNSWVSVPWLGELYPDSLESQWHTQGNLPTGPAGFYRARYSIFSSTFGLTAGTEFMSQASGGAASLFINGNPTGGSLTLFDQTEAYTISGNSPPAALEATLTNEGRILVKKFPFPIVELVGTSFRLNASPATRPDGYDRPELTGSRTKTSLREAWLANVDNLPVMGLVRMDDPLDPTRSAHVVFDGTLRRANGLADDTGRLMAQAIWAYLRAGETDLPVACRTQPAPTITITSPEAKVYQNPSTIPITYTLSWKSPDGTPYTDAYLMGYTSSDPVIVNAYRLNNNEGSISSYRYYQVNGAGIGWPSFGANGFYWGWPTGNIVSPHSWDVSGLPAGSYTFVIYAFPTKSAHNPSYGFHRVQFSIER